MNMIFVSESIRRKKFQNDHVWYIYITMKHFVVVLVEDMIKTAENYFINENAVENIKSSFA